MTRKATLQARPRLFGQSLEKLSEKGSERGFEHRFGQYTNAKTARKVPFRCPVRLRCRGVRDFSDSFRRGILGNCRGGSLEGWSGKARRCTLMHLPYDSHTNRLVSLEDGYLNRHAHIARLSAYDVPADACPRPSNRPPR